MTEQASTENRPKSLRWMVIGAGVVLAGIVLAIVLVNVNAQTKDSADEATFKSCMVLAEREYNAHPELQGDEYRDRLLDVCIEQATD